VPALRQAPRVHPPSQPLDAGALGGNVAGKSSHGRKETHQARVQRHPALNLCATPSLLPRQSTSRSSAASLAMGLGRHDRDRSARNILSNTWFSGTRRLSIRSDKSKSYILSARTLLVSLHSLRTMEKARNVGRGTQGSLLFGMLRSCSRRRRIFGKPRAESSRSKTDTTDK
jgi:hypothetical protein